MKKFFTKRNIFLLVGAVLAIAAFFLAFGASLTLTVSIPMVGEGTSTLTNVIIGVCGSYRQMDLLKYTENLFPEIDKYKKTEIDRKYLVTKFIPTIQTLFQKQCTQDNGQQGGNFLLGCDGKLFEIQNDYSVLEKSEGFACIGCGEVAALGSLYATTKNCKKMTPKNHIICALEAAEKNCMGVQRPFIIVNSKNNEVEVIE